MKEYDVKYDIGQEVKIIQDKKIVTSTIDAIRINHTRPFVDGYDMKHSDGIKIEYLVMVDNKISIRYFEWINQNDIALNDEELIRKMTVVN